MKKPRNLKDYVAYGILGSVFGSLIYMLGWVLALVVIGLFVATMAVIWAISHITSN